MLKHSTLIAHEVANINIPLNREFELVANLKGVVAKSRPEVGHNVDLRYNHMTLVCNYNYAATRLVPLILRVEMEMVVIVAR